MSRAASLFGFAVALAVPAAAHALATEQLGNAPIGAGWGFDTRLLDAVNVEERVYWHEVNGNPTFFFKGGPKAVNQAIRRFAAIPADKREIILLTGPGATHTFDKKPVEYDWTLHVPMGLHFDGDSDVADTRATLTIHVNALRPGPPDDAAKVKRWIGELNSDDFKTRERAARELADVGPSVAAALRQALKDTKAPEARDRLERVLSGVSGEIRIDVLDLPPDIPVIGVEVLLERSRKELSNKAHDVRGFAASSLSRPHVAAEEILPDLEKVLKGDKHEYPLRCAASVASRLGTDGKPLLPALRELLKSDDKNVQNMAQYTIDAIEKAKPDTVPEADAKKRAAIRKEIREFVGERAQKGK
jgi:hypothetical protein